jgi:hypothetical protein
VSPTSAVTPDKPLPRSAVGGLELKFRSRSVVHSSIVTKSPSSARRIIHSIVRCSSPRLPDYTRIIMSPAPSLPEPLDLQHHLAQAVKEQRPSAMKAMGKLLKEKKGVRSLAGGMPHRESTLSVSKPLVDICRQSIPHEACDIHDANCRVHL